MKNDPREVARLCTYSIARHHKHKLYVQWDISRQQYFVDHLPIFSNVNLYITTLDSPDVSVATLTGEVMEAVSRFLYNQSKKLAEVLLDYPHEDWVSYWEK